MKSLERRHQAERFGGEAQERKETWKRVFDPRGGGKLWREKPRSVGS
jgi:hypothetical protein